MAKRRTKLSDLPPEVAALVAPHTKPDMDMLGAISTAISAKRDEAKAARASSGIETVWKEMEEAYIGIDDANRHEFQDAKWAKPMSMDGPVTTGKMPQQPEHKSTVYVRLTARYVDAGSAKLGEILLPSDDKAFTFSEMPVPELIEAKDDHSHVLLDHMGNAPAMRAAQPGEPVPAAPVASPPGQPAAPAAPVTAGGPSPMPAGAPGLTLAPPAPGAIAAPAPAGVPQVPVTVSDFAKENIEIARKKAKAAETRIYGWMVECQHASEMRKVLHDAARIGVGVLKGPVPKVSKAIAALEDKGGVEIEYREEIKPATSWVDPWNIFPDAVCGENIHEGDYIFERDTMSPSQVKALADLPGYIKRQIDYVIDQGPQKGTDSDNGAGGKPTNNKEALKNRFEVWYYYGTLKGDEINAIWHAAGKTVATDKDQVFAVVTLINETVVKAILNPLGSGCYPYHSVPWQRRAGHWAGIGIAEQVRTPQRMINAATRAMLNNAGKSAGSQIVVDRGCITPADNSWTITPDKIWNKMKDATGTVDDAFAVHQIPNQTDPLMKIIEYALQLAEESTSIPLITQGQSGTVEGTTQPNTFGAASLQNNNANQLLRDIGYDFDDFITEPVVRAYYEWLLIDPNVPDAEKGEFKVNAHGSIALVERAIQDQTIAQLFGIAKDPDYKLDPSKVLVQYLKSKRLAAADFQYSDEDWAKKQQQPPPLAPVVQAAQIGADAKLKMAVMKQTVDQQSIASEERIEQAANELEGGHVQNDAQRIQAEAQRTAAEQTVKLHELAVKREIAMLDYANKHNMKLADVKAALAQTAMKLHTQKELNAADNAADNRRNRRRQDKPQKSTPALTAPPVQEPGRAGNGRAYEQGRPQ
jgi:hypothetical protein